MKETEMKSIRLVSNSGFTLVEMVVVVVLLSILMVAVIGLFLTVLKNGGKATAIARVKQEGDYTISTIERRLRYATKIIDTVGDQPFTSSPVGNPVCATGMNYIYFTEKDPAGASQSILIFKNNSRVAMTTDGSNIDYLTSQNVTVGLTGLTIDCEPGTATSGKKVTITLTLNDSQDSRVTQTYNTNVVLRNY
jgi:prepilin-type N-terminal cleavage/methylation domain-containing protein